MNAPLHETAVPQALDKLGVLYRCSGGMPANAQEYAERIEFLGDMQPAWQTVESDALEFARIEALREIDDRFQGQFGKNAAIAEVHRIKVEEAEEVIAKGEDIDAPLLDASRLDGESLTDCAQRVMQAFLDDEVALAHEEKNRLAAKNSVRSAVSIEDLNSVLASYRSE